MNYEYIRIDLMLLLPYGYDIKWMYSAPDCEYREDYLCFFVLKGSKTHTRIALSYPNVFTNNPHI